MATEEQPYQPANAGYAKEADKEATISDIEHLEESRDQQEWTAEEEKRLVKKVDLFLLPTIWIMYLLSYMDRTK
jgi:hypothetical protein